jgi:hypothetical protein
MPKRCCRLYANLLRLRRRAEPMPDLRPEDFENLGDGAPRPFQVPGVYLGRSIGGTTEDTPHGEKIYHKYRVYLTLDLEDRDSIILCRYYSLERDGGGRFIFGADHSYRRDWIAANRGKLPIRFNSLPFSVFEDKLFLLELGTVTTSATGAPIHPSCYYSVIRRIIRPVEDGESFRRYPLEAPKKPRKRR